MLVTFSFSKLKSNLDEDALIALEESKKIYGQLVPLVESNPDYILEAYNSTWKIGYPISLKKFRKVVYEKGVKTNTYDPVRGVIRHIASNAYLHALTVEV